MLLSSNLSLFGRENISSWPDFIDAMEKFKFRLPFLKCLSHTKLIFLSFFFQDKAATHYNIFLASIPSTFTCTLQIPNSLGDIFSQLDSQNETLITHYEKKNREHAKCFLFWENHVSLRIYLTELISKWVEYVSLIIFQVSRNNNKFGEQINRISNNCLWNCHY